MALLVFHLEPGKKAGSLRPGSEDNEGTQPFPVIQAGGEAGRRKGQ